MDMEIPVEKPVPVDLLAAGEAMYTHAATDLVQAQLKLRAGQMQGVGAAATAIRDLARAIDLVMRERANVEKLRKTAAGAVHDTAIDLDAARDEIGRRLARLRDAGDGG